MSKEKELNMPVYEGRLERLSGGASPPGRLNLTRREFIDIGSNHLKNVNSTNYFDELLSTCVGRNVKLLTIKSRAGHFIIGMRLPDRGVVKQGVIGLVSDAFLTTILSWALGIFLSGFVNII